MKMSTRRLLTNHPATYVNPDRSRVRQASYSEIQDLYTSKGDTSKSTRVEKYERHEDLRYLGYSNHTISNIGEDNNNFDTSNFFRPKNGVGHSNFDHSNLKRANKGAQTNNFDHLKLAKNSDTDAEVLMKSSTEIDRIIANWAKFSSSQNEMASRHFEQGSTRNDDLVCSDNDSSVLSTRDKTHYSEKLKEFENMVQTCNANGEYVYLSQVNGSKDNEYSTIVKRRNRSNEIREEEVFTVVKRRHRSNDVNTKTQGEYSTVVKPRNKSTEVSVTTQGEYSTVVKTRNKISAGVDLSLVDSITDKENRRTSPRDSDAGMTGVSSERIVQCEYNGNLSGEASNISDVVGSAEGDYVTVCDVNKNMNLFKLPEPRNKRDRCVNIISGVKKVVNQDSHLNNGNIQDDIDGRYNERVNRREDIGVKKVVNQDRHAYKGNLQGDINGETDEMVNIYDDIEGKKVFNQAAKHNNAGKIHGAIDNMNGDLATSERTDINTLVDQESVKSDADAEDDLKKIIQECLWYFHSQVETQRSHNHHGSRGYSRSHSQSESQAPGLQIDRRYWSSNLKKRTRPRSLTDSTFGTSVGNERHRPRSLTETEPLQSYQRNEVDSRKSKERDVSKQGDGLSLVADVSSRHGSQHTPRVQTLPPRIPAYSSTPAVRRLNQRESSSIRRRPHLERRSKSATVGMSVTSHDTYIHTQKQPDPISKGRMFIEDVLNDISDPKGMDNEDHYTSRENGDGIVRDFDNNEIKSAPHGQNGRVSSTIADTTFRSRFVDTTTSMPRSDVSSFPAPLYRSKSEFHVNVDSKYLTEDGSRHCKSLRSDARSQKPLPNLTKDSKFIRSLSLSKLTSDFKDSHLHDNKNGKSKINCVDYSDKISSVDSSPSDFGVFDIVGEDSGCLYPWQRDASTQYEPVTAVAVDDSQHESNDIQSNTVDEAGDTISKTHQGINTSDIAIVKRQKMFRTNRPHSMGCIDTATFDNELASITNLHSNARARNSEPFIQSPFQRKKSSRGNSDDSSTSNLEAILETSADITLKNCAYRNVLSSPSVSPEMFRDRTELEDSDIVTDEFDEPVFDSPVGKRRKPARHRSSGSITSGSEESDNEPSQPLVARRGRRSAIVDTKNCGDVSPTTLSPEGSPCNSSDEGEDTGGRTGRRRSSVNNIAVNAYPGDLLVQEHHKKLIKRNTIADFYSGRNGSTPNLTDDNKKQRQPFSLLKLMKTRSKESLAQLSDVLQTLKPTEFKDNNLAAYKNIHWTDLIASTDKQGSSGDLLHISAMERKRRESVWELFKSECVFLIDHLMVLKNCFLEPLKKLQVEGFLMYTEPSEIFSNLEDLCYVSYTFCKDFIGSLVKDMSATDFGRTTVLIKALQRFSAHSKDGSVYHTYCLNYSNALTYLEKLRKNDDFCEFEKWCEQDARCNRLQLADLLIGPMQHCTKLPLLLHNIKKYTEDPLEKRQVSESINKVERALEQLEDKMKWLKNFERVQEIQRQLVWPSVTDLDPRAFIPENLKSKFLRQPCARLLACPTRQLLQEGTITLTETTKTIDAYMFLFDDILLVTKIKKKKQKQVPVENTTAPLTDTYTVHRQPLALDRLGIHDLSTQESTASGMKFAFVIVQISRFQQIIDVFTLQAPTELVKNNWLTKIKNAKAQYHSISRANSLKDDGDSNSVQTKSYHAKSRSIDTSFL